MRSVTSRVTEHCRIAVDCRRPEARGGPQSTGENGEKRAYAAQKHAGPVKKNQSGAAAFFGEERGKPRWTNPVCTMGSQWQFAILELESRKRLKNRAFLVIPAHPRDPAREKPTMRSGGVQPQPKIAHNRGSAQPVVAPEAGTTKDRCGSQSLAPLAQSE